MKTENRFAADLKSRAVDAIRQAFERSVGYETKEVTSTMLVPEAGDMVFNTVMSMLQEAHRMT